MYSEYLYINKNFQSSVNLELDLGNDEKIEEYIPTTDICDVMKKYTKSVLGFSKERATTLIGPYGKGKSFLLLVLTFLFGNKKDSSTWTNLVKKISEIDSELGELLLEVKKRNITLLPIIINSNYDNITQSFQLAISEALKRENMDSIIPRSAFDICISLLDKWSSKELVKEEVLQKCLNINDLSIKKLRKGLENYSPLAYKQFEQLYNCVNIGLNFNPLISNDIVKTYSDIANTISKFGYSGLFVIFDEFSKFLESNSADLMRDLKIIQDFAELCTRSSKTNQVHLCCVAHKSIALYDSSSKSKTIGVDSFKTVEGRFVEVRFNRSLDENYQIIAYAINKKDNYSKILNEFLSKNRDFIENIKNIGIFPDSTFENILCKGCFPLNPLTVYSLIQISEYSAQNERTLFTFISDTNNDSFNSFIHSTSSGLFNVDKIYDYFSPLLQKEDSNSIRNIWYRAESILSKIDDIIEKRIIKALAILLMINDSDKLPSNELVLSLCLNIELSIVSLAVNKLIDNHYLRKNMLNNLLSFALSNTKKIDESLEYFKKTKFKSIKYSEFADLINDKKFYIPRKYNEQNKIVRFFRVQFISENDFFAAKSFNYYFENNYCDGLILYLLRDHASETEVESKVAEFNDKRLIVKFPKENITKIFYDSVQRYACLNEVKNQKGLDDITINEINLLLNETETDVRELIDSYFNINFDFYSVLKIDSRITFEELASFVMESLYPIRIIFNNELINKRNVTTQYQKAINHVIDWMFDGNDDFKYSPTSPEMSVKISVIDNNSNYENSISGENFRIIIEKIKSNITEPRSKKIQLYPLSIELQKPPYGLRAGVIPILMAKAISELPDNVILYFQSKEIELNSSNLVKAAFSDKYQLSFSKGSLEQKNYLKKMMSLFNVKTDNNFRKDTLNLADTIKRFFIGLPQIIRLSSEHNNFINADKEFILYKNLFLSFNLNPYEAVFERPKEIFNLKKYDEIFPLIEKIVNNKNSLLTPYKLEIANRVRFLFGLDSKTSLKNGISDYLNAFVSVKEMPIFESEGKKIFEFLNSDNSYDDVLFIEDLAKAITGNRIEDWDTNHADEIINKLSDFKSSLVSVEKMNKSNGTLSELLDKKKILSGMACLLKNNVESILEEFSESVTTSEKVDVLIDLIRELL